MWLGYSLNLFLTQFPPLAAAEMVYGGKSSAGKENTKLFGRRVQRQSPRIPLLVGTMSAGCHLAWEAEADR